MYNGMNHSIKLAIVVHFLESEKKKKSLQKTDLC